MSGADDDEDAMELDENETADESTAAGAFDKLPSLMDAGQASANAVQFCCDLCGTCPIVGYRWHCETCQDFDLCDACYHTGEDVDAPPHAPDHELVRMRVPSLDALALASAVPVPALSAVSLTGSGRSAVPVERDGEEDDEEDEDG